jgi:hypothetical protein
VILTIHGEKGGLGETNLGVSTIREYPAALRPSPGLNRIVFTFTIMSSGLEISGMGISRISYVCGLPKVRTPRARISLYFPITEQN